MTDDTNRTNLTIVVVLIIVVVIAGLAIYAFSSRLFPKENSIQKNESNEMIEKDTSIPDSDIANTAYYIGDNIILTDSTSWHVIEDSDTDHDFVVLLKDIPLDSYVTYDQVSDYLHTTYKRQLQNSLSLNDEDFDLDLLSLTQIEQITGIPSLEVGSSLEDLNQSWLYYKTTLINELDHNNLPILICSRENSDIAKICEGAKENNWPIRPVLNIKKEYIKK